MIFSYVYMHGYLTKHVAIMPDVPPMAKFESWLFNVILGCATGVVGGCDICEFNGDFKVL